MRFGVWKQATIFPVAHHLQQQHQQKYWPRVVSPHALTPVPTLNQQSKWRRKNAIRNWYSTFVFVVTQSYRCVHFQTPIFVQHTFAVSFVSVFRFCRCVFAACYISYYTMSRCAFIRIFRCMFLCFFFGYGILYVFHFPIYLAQSLSESINV